MPLVAHSPQSAGEAVAYPVEPREVRVCATPGCGTRLRRGHGRWNRVRFWMNASSVVDVGRALRAAPRIDWTSIMTGEV